MFCVLHAVDLSLEVCVGIIRECLYSYELLSGCFIFCFELIKDTCGVVGSIVVDNANLSVCHVCDYPVSCSNTLVRVGEAELEYVVLALCNCYLGSRRCELKYSVFECLLGSCYAGTGCCGSDEYFHSVVHQLVVSVNSLFASLLPPPHAASINAIMQESATTTTFVHVFFIFFLPFSSDYWI